MIADLGQLEFHDMPLNSVLLDFCKYTITINVNEYDEEKQGYNEVELLFSGISSFYFQKVDDIKICDITNCNFREEGDKNYIEFNLLSYSPVIPCSMSFYFTDVMIFLHK